MYPNITEFIHLQSKTSRSSPILLPHIARSPDGATPLFSALDYNIRIGSGLATVQGAKDNVSQYAFRLLNFFIVFLNICIHTYIWQ